MIRRKWFLLLSKEDKSKRENAVMVVVIGAKFYHRNQYFMCGY